MLIVNADLEGRIVDIRFDQHIDEIASGLIPRTGERVLDAKGGAVLPGLHDHHMHFLATAAWANSVDCGDVGVADAQALRQVLQQHPGDGWLRGVNYDESIAGELLRWAA
jgi:predicted amidohydrolase YtcJ